MRQIFISFIGYSLIALGLSMLYLVIFRKGRLPNIFSKTWFLILVIIGASLSLFFGWMLVE